MAIDQDHQMEAIIEKNVSMMVRHFYQGESFFTFLKVIPEDLRNSRYVKSSSGGLHMVISGMTSASQQATSSITQIWSWKQQYKTPSMSLLLNVFQATAVLGLDRIRSVQMIRILTRVNCCLHGKHHACSQL